MKKSDLIQDIASELIISGYDVLDLGIGYDKAKVIADILLKRIEKEGMIPPGWVAVMATGKKYNPETDQGRDVLNRYGWEPENEKE
jgi:hypothetical protein